MKLFSQFIGLVFLLSLSGCFPNIGRTNARIEPGIDFGLGLTEGLALSNGKGTAGSLDQSRNVGTFELDLQAGGRNESNRGFAAQIKVPSRFSTIDLYYEFASSHPDYYGIGAEGGALSALYFIYSHFFSDGFSLSLNTRAHYYFLDVAWTPTGGTRNENSNSRFWLNPQISASILTKSGTELALFVSYLYIFGDGVNFRPKCLNLGEAGDSCDDTDIRNQLIAFGITTRF